MAKTLAVSDGPQKGITVVRTSISCHMFSHRLFTPLKNLCLIDVEANVALIWKPRRIPTAVLICKTTVSRYNRTLGLCGNRWNQTWALSSGFLLRDQLIGMKRHAFYMCLAERGTNQNPEGSRSTAQMDPERLRIDFKRRDSQYTYEASMDSGLKKKQKSLTLSTPSHFSLHPLFRWCRHVLR